MTIKTTINLKIFLEVQLIHCEVSMFLFTYCFAMMPSLKSRLALNSERLGLTRFPAGRVKINSLSIQFSCYAQDTVSDSSSGYEQISDKSSKRKGLLWLLLKGTAHHGWEGMVVKKGQSGSKRIGRELGEQATKPQRPFPPTHFLS